MILLIPGGNLEYGQNTFGRGWWYGQSSIELRAWPERGRESFSRGTFEGRVFNYELDFTRQTEERARGFQREEADWTEQCKVKVGEGSQEWHL